MNALFANSVTCFCTFTLRPTTTKSCDTEKGEALQKYDIFYLVELSSEEEEDASRHSTTGCDSLEAYIR